MSETPDPERVDERATELLPEERAAGSDDPRTQCGELRDRDRSIAECQRILFAIFDPCFHQRGEPHKLGPPVSRQPTERAAGVLQRVASLRFGFRGDKVVHRPWQSVIAGSIAIGQDGEKQAAWRQPAELAPSPAVCSLKREMYYEIFKICLTNS